MKHTKTLFTTCVFATTLSLGMAAYAEEPTTTEKIENAGNKAADSVKKGARAVKDKTCEMVNGKMECAAKKLKHKVQNGMDAAGTKVEEVKKEHN